MKPGGSPRGEERIGLTHGGETMGGRSGSMMYGTVLLTFSGLFGQVVGFFYRIALARLIGPETMGLYQLIMPVYSVISSITTVGLTVAPPPSPPNTRPEATAWGSAGCGGAA